MTSSATTASDPFGFFARLVRFVTGLAVVAGFFSGAQAAPQVRELTATQLQRQLGTENGGLHHFVATIEQALTSGAMEKAEVLVDRDALLTRATQQVSFEGDGPIRDIFCDSTRKAWDERGVTRDYAGTRFRFLRVKTIGGRSGLLFRSTGRKNGMNYAMLTVTEPEPGEYRIADIFIVGLNEFLSDTIRRTWLNVAAGFLDEDAGKVKGANPAYVAHIGEVAQISRDINAGKYEEALSGVLALPPAVQIERSVMLIRMEAAEHISMEERNAVYAAWLAAYPDEMELPLKLSAWYTSMRRWDDAERVLRSLMIRLGEDAMLKLEIGTIGMQRDHDRRDAASLSAR